jgi:hypothetical protein
MALKATIHKAQLQLSDMDRNLYCDHSVTIARHPSETDERLVVRLLAIALNAPASLDESPLELAKDMWEPDEPSLWQKDLIMSAHPDRALREAALIMALLDNDDFKEFRFRWGAQNWLEVMRRNSPNDELMPLWNLSPETLLNLQYFVLHKDQTVAGNLQQLTDYLNDPEGERIIRHWRQCYHPGPLIMDEEFDRLLGENDALASQLETMTEGYDRLQSENADLRSQLETMGEHVAAGILNTARPASSSRDGAFTGRSYRLE